MERTNENKGLSIEQLEERFEMVVASKGSSDDSIEINSPIIVL